MGTLLRSFQQLRNGLPNLNVTVPALKVIHLKDVQKVQQHQRYMNKFTICYWMTDGKSETCWDYTHLKRTCRLYFARRIGYEKALRKMSVTLAYIRSKTHSHKNVWTVLGAFKKKIKLILWVDLLPWMRLGFTIKHQNPNSSQNSGKKPVVQRQRRRGRFHQQERPWKWWFGILKAFVYWLSWNG